MKTGKYLLAGILLLGLQSAVVNAGKLQTVPLSADEKADLTYMREEEKLARDTYLTLFDQWGINTFSTIANSEQSHMDAILAKIKKYNLPDPAASTPIGVFQDQELQALYDDLMLAGTLDALHGLQVGALIEEADMRDIKDAIERSQHADIDLVYSNLLCGSRNHLRAFTDAIVAITGAPYTAQLLPQYEVDNIINSTLEQCGR